MQQLTNGRAPLARLRRRGLVAGVGRPLVRTLDGVLDIGEAGSPSGGVFAPAAPVTFVQGPGPRLPHPNIMPIFWGAEWVSASPPIAPATLLDRIHKIIDGPYLDGLVQYGFTGKPTLLGPRFISNSEPPAAASRAAWQANGQALLHSLITADSLAEPDEDWSRLTVVFMPSTFAYPPAGTPGKIVLGFHNTFQWVDEDLFELDDDDDPVWFAMVGTKPTGGLSGLDAATSTFSHELVEAITDPDVASGLVSVAPAGSEIADAPCSQIARLDGVVVSSYWSVLDGACIIPGLSRLAFLQPQEERLDSEDDGPEQSFHVERDCTREHHWSGDYTYHIAKRHLTVTLRAKTTNWVNPTFAWTVAGVNIPVGGATQTVKPSLSVTFPGHPNATAATRTVTLKATATADTLTLVNDPADGVYSVPVVFTVSEPFNAGAPKDPQSWSVNADIEGQQLVYSQAYIDALGRCLGQQVNAISHDMKGIREIYAEFTELLRNHRGPPIDQGVVGPIMLTVSERLRDLRGLAGELRQVRRVLRRG